MDAQIDEKHPAGCGFRSRSCVARGGDRRLQRALSRRDCGEWGRGGRTPVTPALISKPHGGPWNRSTPLRQAIHAPDLKESLKT